MGLYLAMLYITSSVDKAKIVLLNAADNHQTSNITRRKSSNGNQKWFNGGDVHTRGSSVACGAAASAATCMKL